MTLKQSYEMEFQHYYELWRVLNEREGMSINTEWPLYSKTTTRTIFDLKYFSRNCKKRRPGKLHFTIFIYLFFSLEKFTRLFFIEGGWPSPNCKMIKLTTFDSPVTCFRHYDIFAKTGRSRMTSLSLFPTKMTLVHGCALLSQRYWENLLLVVVLVENLKVFYKCSAATS